MPPLAKHFHVAVWLDHSEARLFSLGLTGEDEVTIHAHGQGHIHHKSGSVGGGKAIEDTHFFRDIATALKDAGEILIAGPGSAKDELVRYIQCETPNLQGRIVGVEKMDHPTDNQILTFARRYFRAADRIRH